MADDNTLRSYRSNDPYRRDAGPADSRDQPSGGDPLAELARLIGQADPFAEFGRSNAHAAEPRDPHQVARAAPPIAPDWRTPAVPRGYETMHAGPAPEADPHLAPGAGYAHDPYHPAAVHPDDEPRGEFAHSPAPYQHEPQYAAADEFHQRHHDAQYGAHQDDRAHASYYDHGAPMGPRDDEMYDDAPRKKNLRGGMIWMLTVIGCGIIGTAGAYAFRTYYIEPRATQTPPVITADKTPGKVVPQATDSQSSKFIQDRVREVGPGERVVSREEQPVDLRNPGTASTPRVVLASPVSPSQIQGMPPVPPQAAVPTPPPPPAAAAPATSSPTSTEPKRVRTVTIRPDGTDASGRPVGGLPSGAQPSTGRAAKQQPAARGAPLSLDPQGPRSGPAPVPQRAVAPPAPQRELTPPAPRLAAAPPTAAANGGTGGYVVQVSSQRSEADAKASFRSLQTKFPLLASRSPIVRRADLGAKGVYYRAMVGPFGSSGEADQFCSNLKAAGGQCIIQRN